MNVRMMSRRGWLLAAALIATASLGMHSRIAAAAESWDAYVTFTLATAPNVQGVQRILDGIKQQSNGAVSIRLHLGGSLPINTQNITQAVSDNVVQMGDDAFFQGNVPIVGLLRLPMLLRNLDDFNKAAAVMEPYTTAAYAKKGIVYLGQYAYPLQGPFSRKKLTSLADLKGQKLRPTSPEQGEFLKRFGGIPVSAGAAEVTSGLDRGVFDGVVTASAVGGKAWKEQLKYALRIPLNFGNSPIIVNKAAFDKLAPDVQAKLRKLVQDETQKITTVLQQEDIDATKDFSATGAMVVTEATAQEVAEARRVMIPYWDEWAKARGPEAVEALAKVRAALGR